MKRISTLIFLVSKVHHSEWDSENTRLGEPEEENVLGSFAPPERAVRAILDFASSYEVTDTKSVGKIEWMLN